MLAKSFICFFCFLFAIFFGYGQKSKVDSLMVVVSASKEDTSKVKSLIELAQALRKNSDSSRMYSTQALDLAEKISFPKGLALAYKHIGISYYSQGKKEITLENWNKSLEIYRSMKDSIGIGNMMSNIGAVYYDQGDDVKAAEYYIGALKIAEKINDTLRIATILNNMGSVYNHKIRTKQKAADHFLRSVPLFEGLKDYTAVGTISANIGEIYIEFNKNDSAIYFFNKSLKALENTEKIAQPLNGLGAVHDSLKNYSLALSYYKKADTNARKFKNVRHEIIAKTGIGDVSYKLKDYQTAIKAFQSAEKLAKEANLNPLLEYVYKGLTNTYDAKGDYKNASKYKDELNSVIRFIYDTEAEKDMKNVVFDFEIEKKKDSISLLTTKNELADLELNRQKFAKNALIAGLGLVSLIIFILYRDYLNKAKTNKILDSQKAQIQSLLSNILPDEVAEELQRDGAATPRFYESASVLFTDFKSFTALADRMSPQEVVAELNDCFIEFDAITEKYNIEKIKTIGDAYMCAAGIPVPDPNHYHNIIKAGKEIQAYILRRNKERMAEGLPPWEIRIGIHVGPLVAGVVGKKKYAYDIWGSTVNIASRMESNGEPGQINISSATYELIKDEYECTHRGKIYAKNVGDIDMYFLGDKINKSALIRENVNIPVS